MLRRHTQSLTIKERLGNQAGTATTLSQIGRLRIAQKRALEVIPLQVQALTMRLTLGVPEAARNIETLRGIEGDVGAAVFDDVMKSLLDESDAADFLNLLRHSDGRDDAESGR